MSGYIKFQNFEYDGDELHVGITAYNEMISGYLEIYCDPEDIERFASSLKKFPQGIQDQYRFEFGSEYKPDNWAYYLLLRSYVYDGAGHCALKVRMNNNGDGLNEGLAGFSICTEAAFLNRLGLLLSQFSKKEILEFNFGL